MKKIFESKLFGDNDSAERVHVYQIENHEYWQLYSMSHEEKCYECGVFDESGYEVVPGAVYHTYEFELSVHHLIMIETLALNV